MNHAYCTALAAVLGLSACAHRGNPLALPRDSEFRTNPTLKSKLAFSPHYYFRAVNTAFAQSVCKEWKDRLPSIPVVNLHGDAHVEQIARRLEGIGVFDFDDSAPGPVVLDMVRFGTSVALAAHQKGWTADDAVRAFVDGYVHASGTKTSTAHVPAVIRRLQEVPLQTNVDFLAQSDALMGDFPAARVPELEASIARYVQLMADIGLR